MNFEETLTATKFKKNYAEQEACIRKYIAQCCLVWCGLFQAKVSYLEVFEYPVFTKPN